MLTKCPECEKVQEIPKDYANKEIKCVKCHEPFIAAENMPQSRKNTKLLVVIITLLMINFAWLLKIQFFDTGSRNIPDNLTVEESLTVINYLGDELIKLTAFRNEARIDLFRPGNDIPQLTFFVDAVSRGFKLLQPIVSKSPAYSDPGLIITTDIGNSKIMMINDYGEATKIIPGKVKTFPLGTYMDPIENFRKTK